MTQRRRYGQRLQQALDPRNVQVQRAVRAVTGRTGRALGAGERYAQQLARLRHGRCQHAEEQCVESLTGNWRAEQLYNLARALEL